MYETVKNNSPITKEFMEAVENDADYSLRFPDIDNYSSGQKAFYNEKWAEIGDVRVWEKMGYPVKTYKTFKARELWNLINICATYSAEPGIFFMDNANDMTNAKSYGQQVVCTNPCGEQPLAPYSVCNLAAINLANMVDEENSLKCNLLQIAIAQNKFNVVKDLIKRGIDINYQNTYGETALMRSVLVHIVNKQPAISEIYRILKPSGKFCAFEPIIRSNTRYWQILDPMHIEKYEDFKRVENEIMDNPLDSLCNFDQDTLRTNLEIAGFSIPEVKVQEVKSNYKLKINDEITVFVKEPELTDIEPQDILELVEEVKKIEGVKLLVGTKDRNKIKEYLYRHGYVGIDI